MLINVSSVGPGVAPIDGRPLLAGGSSVQTAPRTRGRAAVRGRRTFVGLLLLLLSGCHATNGWVMNNSGMGYYQKGNYSLARAEFERAVLDDPRNPDHRHNLAMAMQKQGDYATAEQVLRHNLTVDPMHQPTYHALAQTLVAQQRFDEADHLLAGWRDSQPYVPESYIEYAWLQHETGNRAAAEQSLRQALQVKPNHPVALAHLGQLYHENGQADQAAAYYQRSLLSRWNQPQVKSRLATVTGSQSGSVSMRRAAMLHNDPAVPLAAGPMPVGGAQLVDAGMVSDPLAFEEPGRRQRRLRRHRPLRDGGGEQLAAYPLPDFGPSLAGNWPAGGIATLDPGLPPAVVSSPGVLPEFSSQPALAAPVVGASPTPLPQADPAHATDQTAGLPVVDPH